jgi:hypothetical protein
MRILLDIRFDHEPTETERTLVSMSVENLIEREYGEGDLEEEMTDE